MTLIIIVRPDHMQEGRISSCNESPLALAIKEKLGDYTVPRDFVSEGGETVFLSCKGKNWIAKFDSVAFYKNTWNKARSVKLDFKPYELTS